MNQISFITANYVARATSYDGDEDWGKQERATYAADSSAYFTAMAKDIAAAGFEAMDIWGAHCHFHQHAAGDYLEQIKGICSQFDLAISSYAGWVSLQSPADLEQPFKFIKQLGTDIMAGGIMGLPPEQLHPAVEQAAGKYGVRWAFENHSEKTPRDIFEKIGQGKFKHIGVALDTGWCGTQGMDALEAAKRLRDHLMILHLKDVKAAGRHDTCAAGDGVVACEQVVRYLKQTAWQGTICIEHEPYDRDPMPECKMSLQRVREWLK
ncbi:MAG TPA: TIM barrel protein [Tepidisphaeraceae bacterium]|jgi:sugar phosphate isomerase/epimerase